MAAVLILLLAVPAAEAPKSAFVGVQLSARLKADELIIEAVLPDSPAKKAGVLAGDVLLRIDGVTFDALKTAVDAIRALKPGKKAVLRVRRGGKERDIEVIPQGR